MKAKDIVLIGMMATILLVLQVALRFFPNIELITLLIMIYTLVYRWKALIIIYIFVLLEGFIYGFGLWWFNYLYVWSILFFIVTLLRNYQSTYLWAAVSGGFGLLFGALCSIPYFITGGLPSGFAYWISGIPFDLIHGLANFTLAIVLFRPIYLLTKKLHDKMQYQA